MFKILHKYQYKERERQPAQHYLHEEMKSID